MSGRIEYPRDPVPVCIWVIRGFGGIVNMLEGFDNNDIYFSNAGIEELQGYYDRIGRIIEHQKTFIRRR
ncbi:MAG: hypothetical protein QXW38_09525 [Candidatus Nitrosotenuis sp.]